MLQDLVKYYEILSEEEGNNVPQPGYGMVGVSYSLNIDDEGELINITSCKVDNGKRLISRPMLVPEPVKGRTGTKPVPDFLFGNSTYVLGFDNKKKVKGDKEIDRAKECFETFKDFNIELLNKADSVEAQAVVRFLEKWDPYCAEENPHVIENLDDILKGAIFIFRYYGNKDVHRVSSVRKVWDSYKNTTGDRIFQQCLVTGQSVPIVTLHPTIKGLYGGQSMGNSLVSFNASAYESYGKTKGKGLNAPTGEYAAFAYGTILNSLLADSAHKLILGDTTVVFWAESAVREYQDMFSLLMNSSELTEADTDKRWVRSKSAERMVLTILENISVGKDSDMDAFYRNALDYNIKFYVLGMSPNAARVTVRFYLCDTFGSFVERITRHYEDLSIQKQYDHTDMSAIPIWKILNETLSKNSVDKSAPTYLSTSLMRAVLLGESYPSSLYQTILLRIRSEQDITYYKASIIKACLKRKLRQSNTTNKLLEEVLILGLNEKSKNKAYILGRLFAVLEKVQKDANPEIKSTIRDKYFTSASTTPASTFPTLLSLAQHHISKLEYGGAIDKRIAEIMILLDVDDNPFPKNLSLDDQGLFFLGFYHQRNAFYMKPLEN